MPAVRERLLDAQLRFESGEIGSEEYVEIEREWMDKLRELRGAGGAIVVGGEGARVEGIEIDASYDGAERGEEDR